MSFFSRAISKIGLASRRDFAVLAEQNKRYRNAIQAGQFGKATPGWPGVPSKGDEDAGNKGQMQSLGDVLQRSQDLDVNNPDLGGFHRARTAQIVGAHVRFKSAPRSEEVGVAPDKLADICRQIDRVRELHSKAGGFDSTGNRRSEGEQQERCILTAFIHGCCLIHRVWRPNSGLLPFSIELIPGVRISTPYKRMGDPLLSYGIEYSDSHRTQVVAYHVRKVSTNVGDNFVSSFEWDRLPVEDCSLFSMVEPAGNDRAMPLAIRCMRMLRNRGEFIESAVASARAQSRYTSYIECAEGQSPYDASFDDADQQGTDNGTPYGLVTTGDMQTMYLPKGQKVIPNSAKLPDPDFPGFMDHTDSRLSRGLVSSKSRFTRQVSNSYAGGRMEDQQDEPVVDQYRRTFKSAWQMVNNWFTQSLWLTGRVIMPGYAESTSVYWSEYRAEFPGKLHINPTDTQAAREKGFMQRTLTPQQAAEEDGKDLAENLEQWAQAIKMARDAESKHGLKEGTLDYLVSGATLSTSAGDELKGLAEKVPAQDGGEAGGTPPKPSNRFIFNNRSE